MERLLEVMRTLRGPAGCPWDQQQTHASLRPYLLEEAAEAVDAISGGDPKEIAEELGDVLLQVAFHSVIGEAEGSFSYGDVERSIVEKLVHRHPHVFGGTKVENADQVVHNWQALKVKEGKLPKAPCDQVPRSLPALARASELQKKLNVAGDKDRVLMALESGDAGALLWYAASVVRSLGQNPEVALREYCERVCLEASTSPGPQAG